MFRRDGSVLEISQGKARPDIVCYGWLSSLIPYPKGAQLCDHVAFRGLADSIHCRMTLGHHICDFCRWEDSNYGNGEIWIRIESTIYVLPRMIWHYVKDHQYSPPRELRDSLATGNFEALDDNDIATLFDDYEVALVDIPYLTYRALWKEERYKTLADFHEANHFRWHFNECALRDGFFIAKMYLPPRYVEVLFENSPVNFPDTIEVAMVNSGTAANKQINPNNLPGRTKPSN